MCATYHVSSRHRDPTKVKHVNLRADEIPQPGTLVAIDAEFVSLQLVCHNNSS